MHLLWIAKPKRFVTAPAVEASGQVVVFALRAHPVHTSSRNSSGISGIAASIRSAGVMRRLSLQDMPAIQGGAYA
jgi:hypothetical protein